MPRYRRTGRAVAAARKLTGAQPGCDAQSVERARLLELAGWLSALVLLLGMWLSRKVSSLLARQRARAHNLRGRRAEQRAERFLRRHGYRPIGRQVRVSYPVQVAGEEVSVALNADFLVERGGRRFVAEVKSGVEAPRFESADTRRQLLEYQLGFGVESVLLVDMEAGQLREVRFPIAPRQQSWWAGLAYVLVAALSTGVCWLIMR